VANGYLFSVYRISRFSIICLLYQVSGYLVAPKIKIYPSVIGTADFTAQQALIKLAGGIEPGNWKC
jgi:hypothetical protein